MTDCLGDERIVVSIDTIRDIASTIPGIQ